MKMWSIPAVVALSALAAAASANEWSGPARSYYFQTSLATTHFNPQPDHVNNQTLINLERRGESGGIVGGAYFLNSFGQPSEYAYVGKLYWIPNTSETVYAKITGGLLHGYKGDYKDRIPFNQYGVAPAILPALGFQSRTIGGELVVFGTAGAMLTFGFKF